MVQIQIQTQNAQLLMHRVPAQFFLETEKGGFQIESTPSEMQIDNRAFFDSIGLKSLATQASETVTYAKEAVFKAMERYCSEAAALLSPEKITIADLAYQRAQKTIQSMLAFIPEHGPDISWSDARLNISYSPDVLHVSWNPGRVEMKYIPYKVLYDVKDPEADK